MSSPAKMVIIDFDEGMAKESTWEVEGYGTFESDSKKFTFEEILVKKSQCLKYPILWQTIIEIIQDQGDVFSICSTNNGTFGPDRNKEHPERAISGPNFIKDCLELSMPDMDAKRLDSIIVVSYVPKTDSSRFALEDKNEYIAEILSRYNNRHAQSKVPSGHIIFMCNDKYYLRNAVKVFDCHVIYVPTETSEEIPYKTSLENLKEKEFDFFLKTIEALGGTKHKDKLSKMGQLALDRGQKEVHDFLERVRKRVEEDDKAAKTEKESKEKEQEARDQKAFLNMLYLQIKSGKYFSKPHSKDNLLIGMLPDGTKVELQEHNIAKDGSCGFHVLGISRERVVRMLLSLSGDEKVRKTLEPEIANFIKTGDLGFAITDHSRILHQQFMEVINSVSKTEDEVSEILKKFKPDFHHKGIEGLIKYLKEEDLHVLPTPLSISKDDSLNASLKSEDSMAPDTHELLKKLETFLKRQADIMEGISTYARSEEMYKCYVLAYNKGAWLGYKTAKIVAELENMSLYIWYKPNKDKRELQLLEYYEGTGPAVIHMLHTDRFTHFNLLAEPFVESESSKLSQGPTSR